MSKMKRVLIKAPMLSRSGYGEHARFVLRALRSREELFDIYILNIRWGDTGWIWENNEERQFIDRSNQENCFDARRCQESRTTSSF